MIFNLIGSLVAMFLGICMMLYAGDSALIWIVASLFFGGGLYIFIGVIKHFGKVEPV